MLYRTSSQTSKTKSGHKKLLSSSSSFVLLSFPASWPSEHHNKRKRAPFSSRSSPLFSPPVPVPVPVPTAQQPTYTVVNKSPILDRVPLNPTTHRLCRQTLYTIFVLFVQRPASRFCLFPLLSTSSPPTSSYMHDRLFKSDYRPPSTAVQTLIRFATLFVFFFSWSPSAFFVCVHVCACVHHFPIDTMMHVRVATCSQWKE